MYSFMIVESGGDMSYFLLSSPPPPMCHSASVGTYTYLSMVLDIQPRKYLRHVVVKMDQLILAVDTTML